MNVQRASVAAVVVVVMAWCVSVGMRALEGESKVWLDHREEGAQVEADEHAQTPPQVDRQAARLTKAYSRWVQQLEANEPGALVLRVGWIKGLSDEASEARGHVTINLAQRTVAAEVRDLEPDGRYDVWLVDNRDAAGDTVKPEPHDTFIHVGQLEQQGGAFQLQATLDAQVWRSFEIDLAVITRVGQQPDKGGLLYGLPSLFQRMYLADQRDVQVAATDVSIQNIKWNYRPDPHARTKERLEKLRMARLIRAGEKLFFEGTFRGNGRTCGTCHRAENNFTIDPKFIATLPKHDRLFVAEPQFADQFPELQENFENPRLMREFGLIVENVDGLDDLENKFTMRGVPHTLAQPTSLTPAPIDGTDPNVVQRTGWSGDGAPGDGSLRSFAIGAVRQHFTKSTQRREGIDFRFPNDKELDAMEAFQLSLGRQEDVDLTQIEFKDADVAAGLVAFNDAGRCNNCHFNAGANISFVPPAGTFNANFNTGVETVPHPGVALGQTIPPDGGFGTAVNPDGGFGDGTFNTTPLIEAADTAPFFHNNVISTLEEAIAFYTTDAFTNSPAAQFTGPIVLSDEQVANIGKLLRVLNAVENIASAADCIDHASHARSRALKRHLAVCSAEIEDAIEVLSEVDLHESAVKLLAKAKRLVDIASRRGAGSRRHYLKAAVHLLGKARDQMIAMNEPEG